MAIIVDHACSFHELLPGSYFVPGPDECEHRDVRYYDGTNVYALSGTHSRYYDKPRHHGYTEFWFSRPDEPVRKVLYFTDHDKSEIARIGRLLGLQTVSPRRLGCERT